jgi:hypothetical protein
MDCGGSGDDWPWRGSSPCSGASRGVSAIVVFIMNFIRIFVGPWWRTRLRGEIGSGVGADIAWGFGCAVVGVMLIATRGGRWWDMRRNVVV